MRFADPWLLLLLLVVPLAAWLRGRLGEGAAFLYSSVQLVKGISGVRRLQPGKILRRMRWLALTLFVVGLARPQFGEGEVRVTASGIDIILAVDLSGSMAAEDFQLEGVRVNRLVLAKDVLEDFIRKRPSDRLGLVAFASQAYIASPLTLDHSFLLQNLGRLQLGAIEDGTAIGSAITASVNRLRDIEAKSKIVILMTDGQNNSGEVPPTVAAEAAETLGVKIYAVGVGTRGLAPMPQTDPFGRTHYVDVQVDIDEETLRAVADRTGGKYYRADSATTLVEIYDEIDKLEKSDVEMTQYQRYRELFPWLVLSGLTILLLEIILGHTVWRRLP